MNSQSKGYSIILYLIWPFSALYIGLRNFNTKLGRNLLIALYAFLGFTALSIGDLIRYEEEYYLNQNGTIANLFTELISLQTGKFYNDFISIVFGSIFESHHFYFLFLFLIYGYFYINTIHLFTEKLNLELDKTGLLFFSGALLFLLIRPIPNLAFYTGGVFVVYNLVSYYRFGEKKNLYFLIFAPLIHIGLTIYLIVPILLLLFKNKTWYYVIFLILTFVAGKSDVVGALSSLAESNTDTIIESKFDGYASEEGQTRLDERYANNDAGKNIKNRILIITQDVILNFLVPIGVTILFFMKKRLLRDQNIRLLFHTVLLFWSVANLMINISQGARFVLLFSFISVALFFTIYANMDKFGRFNIFSIFLKIFIPTLFLFGIMSTYASNILFKMEFFISNFFIQFFLLH
jgi:hypothetical protein